MVYVSFDIGTTHIKVMVISDQTVLSVDRIRLETQQDGLKRTQDATEILRIIKHQLQTIQKQYTVSACTLVCAMHTVLRLNHDYEPLEAMMLWSDNRGEEVDYSPSLKPYFKTGTPIHPMSPYIKLQTLSKQDLENCLVADLKSYLMVHLTGQFWTDESSASASGLMNIHTQTWDDALLKKCHITPQHCPTIKACHTLTQARGFEPSFDVMIGSTDGVMANIGVQTKPGQCVLSVGTSVGIRTLSDCIILDGNGRTFCYQAPDHQWLIGNASNNGGNLYEWVNQTYYQGSLSYEDFVSIVVSKYPETYAVPYVFGERGPFWKKHLRHHFFTPDASKEEHVRALIYGLFSNIALLKDSLKGILSHEPIALTGGFLHDPRLVQLLADYLEHDLVYIDDENAVCEAALKRLCGFSPKHNETLVKHQKNDALQQYRSTSCSLIHAFVTSSVND